IELTEQQCCVVQEQGGLPVEVRDPSTDQVYVLIAREQYEKVRSLLQTAPGPSEEVAPGIRKSQEALRRDLPALLARKRLRGRWVAYHGDQRLGIARTELELIKECVRRGLGDDQYYVGWIDPTELLE